MINNNFGVKKQANISVTGIISIAISVIMASLVINFLTGMIPIDKLQGLPMIMPLFFSPIGAIIGFISYRVYKDRISLYGIVFNIIMFLVPIIFNIVATMIYGVW